MHAFRPSVYIAMFRAGEPGPIPSDSWKETEFRGSVLRATVGDSGVGLGGGDQLAG